VRSCSAHLREWRTPFGADAIWHSSSTTCEASIDHNPNAESTRTCACDAIVSYSKRVAECVLRKGGALRASVPAGFEPVSGHDMALLERALHGTDACVAHAGCIRMPISRQQGMDARSALIVAVPRLHSRLASRSLSRLELNQSRFAPAAEHGVPDRGTLAPAWNPESMALVFRI